jgi:UDP-N-acetylmuramoylalanine--D-glutamate ligase
MSTSTKDPGIDDHDPPALAGQRVLVVGLGRSGVAAARLCAARGAAVTVTDRKRADELGAALSDLPAGVVRELGGHRRQSFLSADVIVLSPGVPPLAEVSAARAAGVPITGEVELAARFVRAPLVAVTGTNGKSTTTTLAGEILAATGHPTFVGGNLGTPLAEAVGTPAAQPGGFVVVEVSSFQLETTSRFRPRVGILLNITPDHLDRYAGVEDYAATKARLFAAQTPDDYAVLNLDDPRVAMLAGAMTGRGQVLGFSTRRQPAPGQPLAGWVEGGELCLQLPEEDLERYPAGSPGLVGRHNQENALAAALAARLVGATQQEVLATLGAFRPLPHRMTLVGTSGGVAYYDDSKGTNVDAVVAALDGFPRPVVLIAGGRDKGGSYAPLAEALGRVGRAAVLIGEAAARIEEALGTSIKVARAGSMDEAVAVASRLAHVGDAVVLSPACASFDMFRDYKHRGDAFQAAVLRLMGEPVITEEQRAP